MKWISLFFFMQFISIALKSQVSTPANSGVNTDYVGWDLSQNFPLRIEHQAIGTGSAQPIIFSTSLRERLQIHCLPLGASLFGGSVTNTFSGNDLTRISISKDGSLPISSPVSVLHIGDQGGAGKRFWMGNGLYVGGGTDNAFFGLRQKDHNDLSGRTSVQSGIATSSNPDFDNNDLVINWGDNAAGPTGPVSDNLTFNFTDIEFNSTNPWNTNYGREVARMTGTGMFGIGPVFFDNAQPQNMLHINNNSTNAAYLQISNQSNTGQTINDGLHFGITSAGDGELIQKENLDFRFYTNNVQRVVIKSSGDLGLNNNSPNNKIEITSSTGNPYFAGTNGSSGLRFTNLTSLNTPLLNGVNGLNSSKILSVDQNGDVVLTSIPGSLPGNLCGATQNLLSNHFEVPLNNFNLNLTNPINSSSQLNLGFSTCTSSIARLNINDDNLGIGLRSYCNTNGLTTDNIGIQGVGKGNPTIPMLNSVGVLGETGTVTPLGFRMAGVAGFSPGPPSLSSLPTGQSVGVYGNSLLNNGTWAAYFDGDVNFNGSVIGSQWGWVSDQTFKTNIDTINNALSIIKKLKPRSYYFDTTNIYKMKLPFQKQYGLIAQDVYTVMPELVSTQIRASVQTSTASAPTPSLAYKTLNYNAFTAIMIRAIQQLNDQNRKQDSVIKLLIDCCKQNNGNHNGENKMPTNGFNYGNLQNQINVELSDKDIVMLSQNEPNPFAESCVIEYNIPIDFKFAQIVFNNLDGKIIKTVDITQKGKGQLNVFASDLSNGLYGYYLLIDGKITEAKKLIKQN